MIDSQTVCPICDEGTLSATSQKQSVSHKNIAELLDGFMHSECSNCGAAITNNEQARNNKRIVVAYQKHIDGLLTGKEVKAIREKLKLTQSKASKVFGGGPVAFSKYENDDVTQSEAMDKLLRLTQYSDDVFEYLARQADLDMKPIEPLSIPKLFESYRKSSASFEPLAVAHTWGKMHAYKLNTNMNDTYYDDTQSAAA